MHWHPDGSIIALMAQWQKQSSVLGIGRCYVRKPRTYCSILDRYGCEKKYNPTVRHITPLLQILSSSIVHLIPPTYRRYFFLKEHSNSHTCILSVSVNTDNSLCAIWEWPLQPQCPYLTGKNIFKKATISNIFILTIWWFFNLVRWKYRIKIFATAIIIRWKIYKRSVADNRKHLKKYKHY